MCNIFINVFYFVYYYYCYIFHLNVNVDELQICFYAVVFLPPDLVFAPHLLIIVVVIKALEQQDVCPL